MLRHFGNSQSDVKGFGHHQLHCQRPLLLTLLLFGEHSSQHVGIGGNRRYREYHRGVERTLKELATILKKFTPEESASKLEVFWKAGKSVFQEKKVKGVQQRLHEYVEC